MVHACCISLVALESLLLLLKLWVVESMRRSRQCSPRYRGWMILLYKLRIPYGWIGMKLGVLLCFVVGSRGSLRLWNNVARSLAVFLLSFIPWRLSHHRWSSFSVCFRNLMNYVVWSITKFSLELAVLLPWCIVTGLDRTDDDGSWSSWWAR